MRFVDLSHHILTGFELIARDFVEGLLELAKELRNLFYQGGLRVG